MQALIFINVAIGSYYLHRQYHLMKSSLDRFAWFRKKRHLHFEHHRNARVNYAVVEFWIDTFIGTRKD